MLNTNLPILNFRFLQYKICYGVNSLSAGGQIGEGIAAVIEWLNVCEFWLLCNKEGIEVSDNVN